jgi:HK97 family phage major capsid protein
MGTFDQIIQRDQGGASPDPREIPQVVAREVIEGVVEQSVALQVCKTHVMPARTERMPALSMLPSAQWLTGASQQAKDVAKKPTTHVEWQNVTLNAQEIAVLLPIPDAYIADVGVDLFQEVKPRITEAIANALDGAVFFGTSTPWTNSDSDWIYKKAVAAGNTVTYSDTDDVALQVANLSKKLALKGFEPSTFVCQPGFDWLLTADRTTQGVSPYSPGNGVDHVPESLYGKPLAQMRNGAWDNAKAMLIVGDFSKAIIGVRQDITYKLFDQGVITDSAGTTVIYNAVQQDLKILRVVARFAFATVNPIHRLNSDLSGYPFGVLRPAGAPSS